MTISVPSEILDEIKRATIRWTTGFEQLHARVSEILDEHRSRSDFLERAREFMGDFCAFYDRVRDEGNLIWRPLQALSFEDRKHLNQLLQSVLQPYRNAHHQLALKSELLIGHLLMHNSEENFVRADLDNFRCLVAQLNLQDIMRMYKNCLEPQYAAKFIRDRGGIDAYRLHVQKMEEWLGICYLGDQQS